MQTRVGWSVTRHRGVRRAVRATTLLVALVVSGCYEVTPPIHRALTLTMPDTGTGDGASLLLIQASLDTTGVVAAKRSITLTTTAGVFTASSTASAMLVPDQAGTAVALLRAPADSTVALITATANGETVTQLLGYRRALPDRVELLPDQLSLSPGPGNALAVTVQLRRTVGIPSAGLQVVFGTDSLADGSSIRGAFLPASATSDASGIVRTRFSALDTAARGPVTLRATVVKSGISGAAVIQIVKP